MLLADDSQGYSRSYVDLLDDEPVELFLDIVPGEYHRRFGHYFGTVVPGFWDDEPFFASAEAHFKRLPWSPALDGALRTVGATPAPPTPRPSTTSAAPAASPAETTGGPSPTASPPPSASRPSGTRSAASP
ncbi:hypothetical protein ACFQ2H_38805 [Streptomyces violaceoruber]